LIPEDEVGDDFLGLMRFVDRVGLRGDLVNLEPGVRDLDMFERFIFRTRKRLAPVWICAAERAG
jgi:hypothetical protein